jgi:hypothetical protein
VDDSTLIKKGVKADTQKFKGQRILIQQRSDLSTDNVFVAYGFFGFIGFFVSAEVMMAAR